MAEQDYGVRVLHAYRNMTVGRVIFPFGMERGRLLQAGLVEKVVPEDEAAPVKPAAPVKSRAANRIGVPVTAE